MALDFVSTLPPEILLKARDELGEDDQRIADGILAIKEWAKKQPHLQAMPTDTRYLLNFLRGCKYSIEKVKHKLEMTLTLRNALPEFFSGWDPKSPDIQAALSVGMSLPLPGHDHLGRKVYLFRAGCYDPDKISQEIINRTSFMISEVLMQEEEQMYITGIVIIGDFTGFSLSHLAHMDMAQQKKLMPVWDEASPLRPKSMNYINTPAVFNTLMSMFTPLLKEKMRQRIKIHGDNRETLFKEISKDVVPKDFGGDGLSCAELTAMWKKKCEDKREWLLERQKIKADESRRPGRPKTASDLFPGMEGSFRKLNVD